MGQGRGDRGLILDLRDNHGGLAEAAAWLLGRLRQGARVLLTFQGREVDTAIRVPETELQFSGPLVVLVNAASASTAEVLAARLQDLRRAVIIGDRTAGAVVGSRSRALPDGGELQIGMGEARMPDGRTLEGIGVTPDIELPASHAHQRTTDRTLDVALYALDVLRRRAESAARQAEPGEPDA